MQESMQLQEPCARLLPIPPWTWTTQNPSPGAAAATILQAVMKGDWPDDGANIKERKTERKRDEDIKERNRDQEKLTDIQAHTGRDRRADLETD